MRHPNLAPATALATAGLALVLASTGWSVTGAPHSAHLTVTALTGDLAGARADLEAVQAREGVSNRARRDEWIQALRRHENPFTPEVLALLRGH